MTKIMEASNKVIQFYGAQNHRITLRSLVLSFANELDPTERGSAVMDAYDRSKAVIIVCDALINYAERWARELDIQQNIRAYTLQTKEFPMPVLSTLTEGCLDSGRDPSGVNLFGVANVANSLAAIKKLVFDEKAISFDELREALRHNFEGQESLRQMLLNRAPKYGNGDEYVDKIAAEEAAFYCDERNGEHLVFQFEF